MILVISVSQGVVERVGVKAEAWTLETASCQR